MLFMASHVSRRGNVYYFRARVPTHLVELYGRSVVSLSLHTRDPAEARRRARERRVGHGSRWSCADREWPPHHGRGAPVRGKPPHDATPPRAAGRRRRREPRVGARRPARARLGLLASRRDDPDEVNRLPWQGAQNLQRRTALLGLRNVLRCRAGDARQVQVVLEVRDLHLATDVVRRRACNEAEVATQPRLGIVAMRILVAGALGHRVECRDHGRREALGRKPFEGPVGVHDHVVEDRDDPLAVGVQFRPPARPASDRSDRPRTRST